MERKGREENSEGERGREHGTGSLDCVFVTLEGVVEAAHRSQRRSVETMCPAERTNKQM